MTIFTYRAQQGAADPTGDPVSLTIPAAELSRIWPNPVSPSATIRYSVPQASPVTLTLYDVQGREVATLVDTHLEPGGYTCALRADDLSNGVYFLRLKAGAQSDARKLVVLK